MSTESPSVANSNHTRSVRTPLQSAIYEGRVRHRRYSPTTHQFSMPLYMMYLDLSELETVFRGRWFWSIKSPNVSWLRRADYFGDPAKNIESEVKRFVDASLGFVPPGPVRMLTHLRTWGYCFNPVTFYYCYDASGESLEATVTEITNTPWKERHAYALDMRGKDANTTRHAFAKSFHVSPFMPMEQDYEWRLGQPADKLFVHMKNHTTGSDQEHHIFDATLVLRRTDISTRSLARVLVTYPLITVSVILGIYWQAFRLRLKRTPFHPHPKVAARAVA